MKWILSLLGLLIISIGVECQWLGTQPWGAGGAVAVSSGFLGNPYGFGSNLVYWFPMDNTNGLFDPTGHSTNSWTATIGSTTGTVPGLTNAIITNGITLSNISGAGGDAAIQFGTTSISNFSIWPGGGSIANGTISFWIKPTNTVLSAAISTILWCGRNNVGTANYFFVGKNGANFEAGWFNTGGDTRVAVTGANAGWTNQWSYWTVTWSSLGTGLLINGVQFGTNSTAPNIGTLNDFSAPLRIGCAQASVTTTEDPFPGSIDDIAFCSNVLSPVIIMQNYQAGLAGHANNQQWQ